ncbi:hypothetical protein WJM97_02650 [Okeanomitos corallinicola TIOX110]|uniref:Uncharacterized protein n=1 Tax=Okeanomitos corallinicola TIOX110 TaxID=3133117 RepID=A0ABZ2UTH4_9CYAN
MNNHQNLPSTDLSVKLQAITVSVHDATQSCQGNVTLLLALLRQLESLHKEIRDGIFQDSLPDNRQRLYSLLKDIESEGGWPYIERMRLQAFLVNLSAEVDNQNQAIKNTGNSPGIDSSWEW